MSDHGAARRRTWLAWNRTALAAAGFAALAWRIGLAQDRPLDLAAALAAAVAAVVMVLVGRRDTGAVRHGPFVLVGCCLVVTGMITVVGLLA
jgi:Domain of unknown function (DUF202)